MGSAHAVVLFVHDRHYVDVGVIIIMRVVGVIDGPVGTMAGFTFSSIKLEVEHGCLNNPQARPCVFLLIPPNGK